MKATDKERAVEAGRAHLRSWLESAERHGTIYYNVPNIARSGMSRLIQLATIYDWGSTKLVTLWPSLPEGREFDVPSYSGALDIVAKDWGFSFKRRGFVVGGCGMDMVFALVDDLAGKAGLDDRTGHVNGAYANRVKRESFG